MRGSTVRAVEDGQGTVPDDAGDGMDGTDGVGVEPSAEPGGSARATATFRPVVDSSGWEINWGGVAGLVAVVAVVAIAWSWLGGSDADEGLATVDAPTATSAPVRSTTTRVTTTTVAPTTTTTAAPQTTVPERRVIIRGEVKPCQFGDRCLSASFVIEGFDEHPGRFACIYPNSVSDFGFNDNDVDDACLTGDAGDTITIEVAGVRSATISEDDLDGTG